MNPLANKHPGKGTSDAKPDVYTIKGTTQSDFDLIPVRVVNSQVTVKVNRTINPEPGMHTCDTFEVKLSTRGPEGGAVRLWYLNLTVGGQSFPVAPRGTQYEITSSLLTAGSHELY